MSSEKEENTAHDEATPEANGDAAAFTTASAYRRGKRGIFVCKSGARFLVRRPHPEMAMRKERLPSNLTTHARAAIAKAKTASDINAAGQLAFSKMSDEEFAAFMLYARDMVIDVVIAPRIVAGEAQSEDEISADELEPADFWELYVWAERGGATIPVETKGGVLTVSELESFRQDPELSEAQPHGSEVQPQHV